MFEFEDRLTSHNTLSLLLTTHLTGTGDTALLVACSGSSTSSREGELRNYLTNINAELHDRLDEQVRRCRVKQVAEGKR